MKMRRIIVFLLTFFIIMSGCEYKLHDNYIDVPSSDISVPQVSLKTVYDSNKKYDKDTVYFYGNIGYIEYDIKTFNNQKLVRCVFKYNDETVELTEMSGDFMIPFSSDITKKLTCEVFVTSGAGSIADQTNVVSNTTNYSWSVAFDVEPEPSFAFRADEAGYLELSWKKPPIFADRFKFYKISVNGEELVVINDIEKTSFLYESYCGEECHIGVRVVYDDDKSWNLGGSNIYTHIYFDYDFSRDDSVTVSWTNDFNATTSIISDNDTILKTKGRTALLPYSKFGASRTPITYAFSSYNEEGPAYKWNKFEKTDYAELSPGIKFISDFPSDRSKIAYNVVEDVLYLTYNVRFGTELSSWQFPEMSQVSYRSGVDYLISSYTDSKIVGRGFNMEVFGGKQLNIVKDFMLEDYSNARVYTITSDNKLIFVTDKSLDEVFLIVYDYATASIEKKINIPANIFNFYTEHILISPDSKYIYTVNNGNIDIMKLDDYNITGVKRLDGPFSGGWCVNPLKSDQLFVSDNKSIKEYDSDDLTVVYSWNYPDMKIGNIDTKTGYLLIYDSNHVKIIDTSTKELIYEREVAGDLFYIYGNTLISERGHALNLDKYIKK